jgi:NAD-specific glutamate dehydrogenase
MDIVQLSDNLHHDVLATGRAYFGVGVDFGLLLVRRQARLLSATTQWRRLAVDALIDDFYVQQREITQRLITANTASTPAIAGSPLQEVLAEITRTSPPDLAMLTVASRRIRTAGAAV